MCVHVSHFVASVVVKLATACLSVINLSIAHLQPLTNSPQMTILLNPTLLMRTEILAGNTGLLLMLHELSSALLLHHLIGCAF